MGSHWIGTCNFVKKIWASQDVLEEFNQTYICLIHKASNHEFINQFLPIFLYNNLYKIISKMVVNKLKIIIPQSVSHFQMGFILGRSIHDNILVT